MNVPNSIPLSVSVRKFRAVAFIVVTLILAGLSQPASADLLDLYIGGSLGEGQVNATSASEIPAPYRFSQNHFAFKLLAGIRPISLIGAEVEYVDFGRPSGSLGGAPANVTMKGPAAFVVLYLPVPIVDVFVKAGVARMQTTIDGNEYEECPAYVSANGTGPICPPSVPFRADRTDTSFAGGAGVQYKLGAFAVRGEYEEFTAAGEHPRLVSIGATWEFL